MVLYTLASPQNLKYDSESACIAAQHMLRGHASTCHRGHVSELTLCISRMQ